MVRTASSDGRASPISGAGALIAAGSVITRDVAPDALAVARGDQVEKAGRAAQYRELMKARKKQS